MLMVSKTSAMSDRSESFVRSVLDELLVKMKGPSWGRGPSNVDCSLAAIKQNWWRLGTGIFRDRLQQFAVKTVPFA